MPLDAFQTPCESLHAAAPAPPECPLGCFQPRFRGGGATLLGSRFIDLLEVTELPKLQKSKRHSARWSMFLQPANRAMRRTLAMGAAARTDRLNIGLSAPPSR